MKRFLLLAALVVVCAVSAMAEDKPATPPGQMDMANMPMGRPAEMDQVQWMIGTWDADMSINMGGPEMEKSKGVSIWKPILGGCALENSFEGSMMSQPFTGSGLLCYNRGTSQWQSTWIDNMSAALGIYVGGMKDGAMVFEGVDEMMGQKVNMRFSSTKVTDDKFDWKMEMSMDGGKTWQLAGSAVYTKRK